MSHRSVAQECHSGTHTHCTGLVPSWESPSLVRNCACNCHRGETAVLSRYTLAAIPKVMA